MNISLHWLSDFITLRPLRSTQGLQGVVPMQEVSAVLSAVEARQAQGPVSGTLIETDPQRLADAVTEHVAEVDDVSVQGGLLGHCVVGKVLDVQKHPHADRLHLCTVQTDRGTKRVVCGGTNLRPGMRVAFAHVGATVRWHGTEMVTLSKANVRGEESEGMICAAEELDLTAQFPQATEHTIIDLGDGDEGVGKPLREYLGLDDVVLHIDNHAITNRPDLFSHIGVARELVAIGLAAWKMKPGLPPIDFSTHPFPFPIAARQPKLVPRYEACIVEIDEPGETPAWMRKRLEATGWRSINLPIDITNYVMMETGMPLHSFDAHDIKGEVTMRRAKKGEKIKTLDGEERALSAGALVMEDGEGIFDLLGIMGGLRGSTKETTRRIWLHSAVVDAVNTRKTVVAMGHRTDAATIYEKGVPPVAARLGLHRALQLFLELVPGARIISVPLSWGEDGTAKPITLRLTRLRSMLGTDVTAERAADILRTLGCSVELNGKTLKVTPPLWRIGDLRGDHDLIEEVGRIVGYNAIEPVMPKAALTPPPRNHRVNVLRDAFKEAGYTEILPLSLVGASLIEKAGMKAEEAMSIRNPLGEELRHPHTSTLPGLLSNAQRNILLAGTELRTFTIAHVFKKGGEEHQELSILLADLDGKGTQDLKSDPFLLLKRDLAQAFSDLHLSSAFETEENPAPFAHPGRSAAVSAEGEMIGHLFELHPDIRARFDLPHRVSVALIDLTALKALQGKIRPPSPLPAFPAVTYDVTVPRAQENPTGSLLSTLQKGSELLENVEVIDLFSSKDTGERTYNLTLRFTYRAKDRTLTEQEAKGEHDRIVKILAS